MDPINQSPTSFSINPPPPHENYERRYPSVPQQGYQYNQHTPPPPQQQQLQLQQLQELQQLQLQELKLQMQQQQQPRAQPQKQLSFYGGGGIDISRCAYWPFAGDHSPGCNTKTLGMMYSPESLSRSVWKRVCKGYRFYIRPFAYLILLIGFALYWYTVMNNVSTWRADAMADERGYNIINNNNNNQASLPSDRYPTSNNGALHDMGHERFAIVTGDEYESWVLFLNISLAIFMIIAVLMRLILLDFVRLAEYLLVMSTLFIVSGFFHILTQYPDPWGSHESCENPEYHTLGRWVFTRLKTEFCGDQMWSGHAFNITAAAIMMRRLIYDYIGWASIPLTCLTHTVANCDQKLFDQQTENPSGPGSGSTGRQEAPHPQLDDTNTIIDMIESRTVMNRSTEHSREKRAPSTTFNNDDNQVVLNLPPSNPSFEKETSRVSLSRLQQITCFYLRLKRLAPNYYDPRDMESGEYSQQLFSEFPTQRGLGMNSLLRYQVNTLTSERIVMSPIPTPPIILKHPNWTLALTTLFRAVLIAWQTLFYIALLKARFHYTTDVLVGILVTVLLSHSTGYLQWMISWLYRPVDSRYEDAPVYPFSCHPQLYEERLSKAGIGGII